VPETLLPGGALCDQVGICIGGLCVGLLMSFVALAVVFLIIREREWAREGEKPALPAVTHAINSQQTNRSFSAATATAGATPALLTSAKVGKGKGISKRGTPEKRKQTTVAEEIACRAEQPGAQGAGEGWEEGWTGSLDFARVVSMPAADVELLEKRCEELEKEINRERTQRNLEKKQRILNDGWQEGLIMGERDQAYQLARSQAKEVEDLVQALHDANTRVHHLETHSRRWKEDAEAAEARIARISREKAAAEKAAEVLESLLAHDTDAASAATFSSAQFSMYSAHDRELAPAEQQHSKTAAAGKRRPPAVHADLGMTPTHLAYSTPMPISTPKTPTPTMHISVSNSLTPTHSHTGMAPIGTPTHLNSSLAPSPHMSGGGGRIASLPVGTPVRSLVGSMDNSLEQQRPGSTTRADDSGWSTAPGTPVSLWKEKKRVTCLTFSLWKRVLLRLM